MAKHARHVEIHVKEYKRTKFRHELYRAENRNPVEEWLGRTRPDSRYCDRQLLSQVFNAIPFLESFNATCSKYPYIEFPKDVRDSWPEMLDGNPALGDDVTVLSRRFSDIMVAVSKRTLGKPLRKIVCEGVPLDTLQTKELRPMHLASASSDVTDLRIEIDVSCQHLHSVYFPAWRIRRRIRCKIRLRSNRWILNEYCWIWSLNHSPALEWKCRS